MAILGKIFDANRREVKSLSKLADKVLAKDEEYSNLSDEELVNKTEEFKAYIQEQKEKGKDNHKQPPALAQFPNNRTEKPVDTKLRAKKESP